ncbi:MAG TPA: DUF4136 domain-containing protein [Polyangiaceae bacterium]|nr:DUF4136 domain-containing protein [Polyangiaceae bacterium]
MKTPHTRSASRLSLLGVVVPALVLATAVGCAPAVDVHTMTAPSAHFERYRTFAFDPTQAAPDAYALSAQSGAVRARIQESVATILEGRGYVPAGSGKADLVVRIETGRREPTPAERVGQPQPGQAEMQYTATLDDESLDRVEGAFIVDAFDADSHLLLWHGSARAAVDPTRVDYGRLQRAVDHVLATFPARTAP